MTGEQLFTITGSPWPERNGCVARIVPEPPGPPVYPWAGRGKREAVVYIHADPLGPPTRCERGPRWSWSCAMDRSNLVAEAAP